MIVLSVGHYRKLPSKCDGSHDPYPWDGSCLAARACEHEEARRWVDRVAYYLREQTQVQVIDPVRLGDKCRAVNDIHARTPVDLAVEIHFNACGGCPAHGSETLYCPPSVSRFPGRGQRAAEIVQSFLGRVFTPSRGIKEGWFRGDLPGHVDYKGDVPGDEKPDFFLKACRPIALIVEPEFIHNIERIQDLFDLGTRELAMGILTAAEAMRTGVNLQR